MTLYEEIKVSGIEHCNHYSDLYVMSTDEARAILRKHGKTGHPFRNQIDGNIWLDVPFAYQPFWDDVQRKSEARTKQVKS